MLQKYGKLPAWSKVRKKPCPVHLAPEFHTPVVDVVVCVPELTVHMIESPSLIVTLAWPNTRFSMLTFTVLDSLVAAVVVVTGAVVVTGEVGEVGTVVVEAGFALGEPPPTRVDVVVVSAEPPVVVTPADVVVDSSAAPVVALDVVWLSVVLLQAAGTSSSSEPRTNRKLLAFIMKR